MIIDDSELTKLKPLYDALYKLSLSCIEDTLMGSSKSPPNEKEDKDLIIASCHHLIALIALNMLKQSEDNEHRWSELTEEEQLSIVRDKSLINIIDECLIRNNNKQELITMGMKFRGRQFSTKSLNEYEEIFVQYEAIKKATGKENYSLAVYRCARLKKIESETDIKRLYKRFIKFRDKNKLSSNADFKKYVSTIR